LNCISRKIRKGNGATRNHESRLAGCRLRRLGARPWRRHGEQVPRLPPCARPIPAGHTQPSPDTKARRSGGTRKGRYAVCTKRPTAVTPPLLKSVKGMALRATTKAGLPGVVCDDKARRDAAPPKAETQRWGEPRRDGHPRYDKARRDAAPPKAEAPRCGEPHRAGRAFARLRCGTGARKRDNGPTDAAPETFVLGRRPISCPAKRGFVSAGSGGDAAHRKGMGWRRPCSHGSARSLASRAANGGPPRRWLSWSRASASRNDGFRHKHPQLCTKPPKKNAPSIGAVLRAFSFVSRW